MAALGYLAKLKSQCKYSLIPYQLAKLQCHTFFLSQDIKQNVLLSSCLDN